MVFGVYYASIGFGRVVLLYEASVRAFDEDV
jgi:hypothetical protein